MKCLKVSQFLFVLCLVARGAFAEDIFRESFEDSGQSGVFSNTWGDKPTTIVSNAIVPAVGINGSAAARLGIEFPADVPHNLSYWNYTLPERVPLAPELESISFRVKTNAPVSIKIAIWPFGFIYHGPGVNPSDQWQTVTLKCYDFQPSRYCFRMN